jgi:hypothetical protein
MSVETERYDRYVADCFQAVEDAVKRGFDIISISWSVQRDDSDNEAKNNTVDLERLRKSLLLASSSQKNQQGKKIGKETLLFCSAPDKGQSKLKDSHYPFNCEGITKMFKIGAAQATGKEYPWTGDQVDFLLPGENVVMAPSDQSMSGDNLPRTGSSVATALAAGLAAMIIHCVRLSALCNIDVKSHSGVAHERAVRAIKTFDSMKAAFLRISETQPGKTDRRLGVETFFKQAGKNLG